MSLILAYFPAMNRFLIFLLILVIVPLKARSQSISVSDTTRLLGEVVVQAFSYDRPLHEIPAAVGFIGERDLSRFSNTSFLPALNTIAGVRMEERSPGSYRLSIRGSTLRSPFGIRNVKVYLNEIPFTDPGGNTYLNLLDFGSVQKAEVIKGPAGSLYGAGTGGVLLLSAPGAAYKTSKVSLSALTGSYDLLRYVLRAESGDENANTVIQYSHQELDGYRQQSAMTRDIAQVNGRYRISDNRMLNVILFYSDLAYQTPGGITRAQYDTLPSAARAIAIDQKTAIYNKTFFAGVSHEYQWNDRWSNRTAVYGTFTQFENPFVNNFEKRAEQNAGARTTFQYAFSKGKLNVGAELQHGFSPITIYDNNGGVTGDIQSIDELTSDASFVFTQAEFFLPAQFFLTVGASLNFNTIVYRKLSDSPPFRERRNFNPVVSPRIALLKIINDQFSIYGSVSRGFSPPTVAELFPSTATFSRDLNPEQGTNSEVGAHGRFFNNRLTFNVTGYAFRLDETITVRRNEAGNDYFVNAGKTNQNGIELDLAWNMPARPENFFHDLRIWSTLSLNDYRFASYMQDTISFNDNKLTGAPPIAVAGGIDVATRWKIYANVTLTYTGKIPLNDANTVFADAYTLAGVRAGYRNILFKNVTVDIFAGIDNAFDERYSLGNDLNAFGGRYFNAAAPRNFYAGITASLNLSRR